MFASRLSCWSLVGASVLGLGLAACNKGGSASKDDLALVPKETQIVFGANLARMRGTAMWKKMVDYGASNPQSKKDYEEFVSNCVDLNGPSGPVSFFVALPIPSGGAKDVEVIIRLNDSIDDARTNKCFTYVATKNNDKLAEADYNGKKVYTTTRGDDKTAVAQLDAKTLVFGSEGWVHRTIDLASGKDPASAKTNAELAALVKEAKTSEAVWGAAIVPQSARDSFKADPKLASMASLKSVVGAVDFASGLAVDVNLETGSEADAKGFNTQVQAQLADLKKMPQVMMLGIASWLDGITTDSKGATFNVKLTYTQPQVDDMVARLQGLMKSFGAGLGGGGMMGGPPSMGGPPPGMGGPGGPAVVDTNSPGPAKMPSLGTPQLAPPPGGAAPAVPTPPAQAPAPSAPAH